jgi:Concanavalin A-like lectin/glucanases superfamily
MIASRLVLWHNYHGDVAFDLSENRNHGTIVDAVYDSPGFLDSLHFTGGPGAVWVAPSTSLETLGAVRAQVHFHWDPTGSHRHNLIEGELSFALFVNPDGSLQGTILNSLGNWEGATSAPGVVPTGEWHTAEFVHDGICHCELYLDGHVVAEGYSSPGPVASVSARGVAIAHWPEPSDVYSFEGYIDNVRVWCQDPVQNGGQLIDECCIDRPAIAKQTAALDAAGLDATKLGETVHSMLDIGRQAAYYMAQGSQAERDSALALGGQFLQAYMSGDREGFIHVAQTGAELLQNTAPAGLVDQLWGQLEPLLAPLQKLVGDEKDQPGEIARWLAPWCLDGFVPPSPKREPPPPATDNSSDPDTDAPLGTEPPGWTDPSQHEQVPPPPPPPAGGGGQPAESGGR